MKPRLWKGNPAMQSFLRSRIPVFLLSIAMLCFFTARAFAKDPQLVPRRLSSTGDSISAGIDVEYYGQNSNASWVNGYYGFWQWLLGLTDVRSHNQRITAQWGSGGRTNYMDAVSGADIFDLPLQTSQAVSQSAYYVTIFMGHNDVCQDHFEDIPSDAVFEANFRQGMENLKNGLPNGATVYVLAIVDIYRLYVVGQDKKALGIVDCELLWATTLLNWFPCGTMLNPLISEADRQFTRSRNIAFNKILERVTAEYNAADPHHYYYWTKLPFVFPFNESHVSNLDCFHPSAKGQKTLSAVAWYVGPFRTFGEGD
ncbi:MAG: SGNH/GDSL hydrolase family protein [Candidatus Abyssobacteria bacterium SURF_5]|uniref:SGNH/GDSL hydrolase family protein n=1 Tax=Abyssobacteria bacterium (strain SURF_5) TaxID=2093360 RepID=A0A3A4NKC5_ABYX5|nr:MAG: SGNH/GDSL hydrolase family protein [Candidatus Abyssubacteria bacterium SURF_5]